MAQAEVDKAKNIMQKNVEGMIKNIQDAEVFAYLITCFRTSKSKAKEFATMQISL